MSDKIMNFVTRFPWLVMALFVAFTILIGSQLPKAQVDPEVKNQLPKDFKSRVLTDKIEEIFGGTEFLMVVMEADDILATDTLKRLQKISRKMDRLSKMFDRVISPFELKDIRSEDGALYVDPAIRRIPKTDKQREELRQQLKDNDLVYGVVVAKDFTAAIVGGTVSVEAMDYEVLSEVNKILDEAPGPEKIYIVGMPYTRTQLGDNIRGDMKNFLPYGILIMLIFLFVCFKQIRGVVLPFLMVIMAIIVSLGFIPIFGWKIQMITVILPVMLIAVANDYGIHIMAKYQEENRPGDTRSKAEVAKKIIKDLGWPVIFTGITTVAGMLCLLAHIIIPAEQMGILASLGVMIALIGSLTFIPAALVVMPRAKPLKAIAGEDGDHKKALLERMLEAVAKLVTTHPKAVIAALFLGAVGTGMGIFMLVIDTNPINYYPPDNPIVISSNLVNEKFGGATSIQVVAEGDIKDPAVMGKIDELHVKLEQHPDVGQVTSIAEIARELNQTMHDDDPKYDRIPESRDLTAQYFLLYENSGEPEDFEKLVDFEYKKAQVTVRINSEATSAINRVYKEIQNYVAQKGNEVFTIVGGYGAVFSELVDGVVNGQVYSLSISLIVVSLLLMILFRSFMAGFLSVIPLALAMIILFGLMGFIGIELNIATAMLSSIMIGVGVDYTIHFLWRYRVELQSGKEHKEAVISTLTTTGRGIVFNALSVVIGFAVLILSVFLPVQFFGILVVVSISSCLVGALVLLPALVLVFKPKFLEPKA